jgi:hypothetical protein
MTATKRVKHIPQRTCVGCRQVLAKRRLVRLVRVAGEGEMSVVKIDPTGKAAGRGAYLHDRRSCWQSGLQSGAVERALKVTLSEADRAALSAHGQQYSDERAD